MLGVLASIAAIVINANARTGAMAAPIIATTLNVALLVLWTFRFTPDWVRIAAEAYAERLLETVEAPHSPTSEPESPLVDASHRPSHH